MLLKRSSECLRQEAKTRVIEASIRPLLLRLLASTPSAVVSRALLQLRAVFIHRRSRLPVARVLVKHDARRRIILVQNAPRR